MYRTIVTRLAILVCLLTFAGLPSFAGSEPLPLPEPAGSPRLPTLTPELIAPIDGKVHDIYDSFIWSHVDSATEYLLTIKNVRTGEKIQFGYATDEACAGTKCVSKSLLNVVLTEVMRDGDAFRWFVTAVIADIVEVDSAKATGVMNEVDDVTLLYPAPHMIHSAGSALMFSWSDSSIASSYTVHVKDKTTGGVVISNGDFRVNLCVGGTCSYVATPEEQAALVDGHRYTWHVAVESDSGEKAKSSKRKFTVAG